MRKRGRKREGKVPSVGEEAEQGVAVRPVSLRVEGTIGPTTWGGGGGAC